MKNNKFAFRRILSLFLAIVISITMPDMTAFATENDYGTKAPDVTEESGDITSPDAQMAALDAAIENGLRQREERISLEKYNKTLDEFKAAIPRFDHHYPLNCIIERYGYECNDDGILVAIYIQYKEDCETTIQEMNESASEIIDVINGSSREFEDYEKAWLVYEWLARTCQYDPNYDLTLGINSPNLDPGCFTAYNALVKKQAVCNGYALGYAYVMKELLGIPCDTVDSKDHAWNMIQIDGHWYHVDTTWGNSSGAVNGDYFLLTDEELTVIDPSVHHRMTGKKAYNVGDGDGPSFEDKNPLWLYYNRLGFEEHGRLHFIYDITFYEGCYYYSSVYRVMRTESLLGYDSQTADTCQEIKRIDASDSDLFGVTMPQPMDLCVKNNCLYFHGKQRIYRLNLAEVDEDLRDIVTNPKTPVDIAEDITSLVVPESDPAYETLDVANMKEKHEGYLFISDFNVSEEDGKIRFNIYRSGKLVEECEFPYLTDINSFGDSKDYINVTGDLEVGTQLKAAVTLPDSIKPAHYETATAYYRWYRGDDFICANTSGTYTPTEDDLGKTLRLEVVFDNYVGKISKEIGTLPKMIPTLPSEEPEAVTGEKGSTLADIELPDGYVWKEPDTVLTEIGEHSYPASYSPDSDKYEFIDASLKVIITECSHEWDEGTITKSVTCTEPGERTFTCNKCNDTKTEPIEPVGHTWDNGSTTEKATCAKAGTKTYTCYRCSETKTEDIPKTTNHNYNSGKIAKAPTATEKGDYVWSCSVCGSEKTVSILLAKTGNFSSGMTSVPVRSSAEKTDNTIGSLKKDAEIIIFEENSTSGWTKICYGDGVGFIMTRYVVTTSPTSTAKPTGTADPTSTTRPTTTTRPNQTTEIGSQTTVKNMTYKLTSASTVEFTKTSIKSGTVTIPATIKVNGKTCMVTSIAAKAMKNNKEIEKVVIGSNVTKIGSGAFQGCKKLKTITIKSSKLKMVGKNAIKNIHKRAKISCPKKKKSIYKKYFTPGTGYEKTMKIK